MKTAVESPKLLALAEACNSGACNVGGLARSLPAALDEIGPWCPPNHPAVQVIIGHLAFLCGQAAGPTCESYSDYRAWRDGCGFDKRDRWRQQLNALSAETANA